MIRPQVVSLPKILVCQTSKIYSLLRLYLTKLFSQSIIKGSKTYLLP